MPRISPKQALWRTRNAAQGGYTRIVGKTRLGRSESRKQPSDGGFPAKPRKTGSVRRYARRKGDSGAATP